MSRKRRAQLAVLLAALLLSQPVLAAARTATPIRFGLMAPPSAPGGDALRSQLDRANRERLAFVVATGLKSGSEACADALYEERKSLLDESVHPLMLTLTAADWAECRREDGSSAAAERLARARDLFFEGTSSLGQRSIAVVRQSSAAQFRSFSEHMRWEVRGALFATLNVPADNNHYLRAAGRNGEFEDRIVANRHWLQRLLQAARTHDARLVVLFFEADPGLFATPPRQRAGERDGYAELRKQLREFASRFNGRLLLVHRSGERQGAQAAPKAQWKGNIGQLGLPAHGLTEVAVNPATGAVLARASKRQGG